MNPKLVLLIAIGVIALILLWPRKAKVANYKIVGGGFNFIGDLPSLMMQIESHYNPEIHQFRLEIGRDEPLVSLDHIQDRICKTREKRIGLTVIPRRGRQRTNLTITRL